MTQIGFVGIGKMGEALVRRLLAGGHAVAVWNRTPEKAQALEAAGASIAASPRAAAGGAAAVFSSVTDDAASRAVWCGPDGLLAAAAAPGTLAIECSTLSRPWVLELAGRVEAQGWHYLDCPVAGRPDAAAAGQLSAHVGGSEAALAAARPLLAAFAKSILHFGPAGAGTTFKLIYNLMSATQVAALAEALAVAEAAGLDLRSVARALAAGSGGSAHVVRHSALMAEGRYPQPVDFPGAGRVKDCRYGVALAESCGVSAPLGRATLAAFDAMVGRGMGDRNDSEIFEMLRAGRKPRPDETA